ncbi:MAG: NYN domain-containing protein [Candidatus Omnitrophota bacterium]
MLQVRKDKVMIFVDGNYVYKCLEDIKKGLDAKHLSLLLEAVFKKLNGDNDLRRIYYYNSYPPLESDKSRAEGVAKLIWQIENKTKKSLSDIQNEIKNMFTQHLPREEVLKKLGLTAQEFEAQALHKKSKQQMKFYEVLEYHGFKVILNKLKKDKYGHYYQKGVDIYIASDMLSLAFEHGYDTSVLVSGDADFIEVVNKIQEKGKRVILSCFECGKSWELQRICDDFICLDSIHEEMVSSNR